jgi:hypothetical protein
MPRHVSAQGDIAFVTLTRGCHAVIDAEDAPKVAQYNWCAFPRGHLMYARACIQVNGKPRALFLHQLVMGKCYGLDVDHIDGDPLNNRRSNLRLATRAQNICNSRKRRRAKLSSVYKGVAFLHKNQRWWSRIRVEDRDRSLGCYATPEDAARAYDAAADHYFGEFAKTNVALGLLPPLSVTLSSTAYVFQLPLQF